jgi:hypothetical protein
VRVKLTSAFIIICNPSGLVLLSRYCAEATFRIGILEQRLERQEALVTKKYQELERRLQSDPRLALIYSGAATATTHAGRSVGSPSLSRPARTAHS